MKIKAVYPTLIGAVLFISCVAYASQAPAGESDVNAQVLCEISSRNQMLTAKAEIWKYGTTAAMNICSDAVYTSDQAGMHKTSD